MQPENEDQELRKIAIRRVREKRELYMHFASYLVVNTALVTIWAITGAGYPWFVWPLVGWGVGIAFHAFAVFFRVDPIPGGPRDESAIAREIGRLRRAQTQRPTLR
jgi:hypothetical protein